VTPDELVTGLRDEAKCRILWTLVDAVADRYGMGGSR